MSQQYHLKVQTIDKNTKFFEVSFCFSHCICHMCASFPPPWLILIFQNKKLFLGQAPSQVYAPSSLYQFLQCIYGTHLDNCFSKSTYHIYFFFLISYICSSMKNIVRLTWFADLTHHIKILFNSMVLILTNKFQVMSFNIAPSFCL